MREGGHQIDQRILWETQHKNRQIESQEIEMQPNNFAIRCLNYIPEKGNVLEFGPANGRDARYFAREKRCNVVGVDFSFNALEQLQEAAKRDGTYGKVQPIVGDIRHLPFSNHHSFDAMYARSALHLSDQQFDIFLGEIESLIKQGGYFMAEGKTHDDFKIQRSSVVDDNLCMDIDGHVRRVWDEETTKRILAEHGYETIEIQKGDEMIHEKLTQFINFIARKI